MARERWEVLVVNAECEVCHGMGFVRGGAGWQPCECLSRQAVYSGGNGEIVLGHSGPRKLRGG